MGKLIKETVKNRNVLWDFHRIKKMMRKHQKIRITQAVSKKPEIKKIT